jgi:RNA polymerase sigma-70 factor (ECF subfamily)
MNETLTDRLSADLDGSFEALVREHQDRLYSLALRYVGGAADAEELTQDAFVRAYRALEKYEAERIRELDLRPWLTTIVLNLCRNHVVRPASKAAAATVNVDDVAWLQSDGQRGPEAQVERREAAERWAALVASLPPVYRAAVLLRHLDGMSYDEMSTVLGRPEGTLKAQVHRGVALLRAAFEADERARRGDHSSSGGEAAHTSPSPILAAALEAHS